MSHGLPGHRRQEKSVLSELPRLPRLTRLDVTPRGLKQYSPAKILHTKVDCLGARVEPAPGGESSRTLYKLTLLRSPSRSGPRRRMRHTTWTGPFSGVLGGSESTDVQQNLNSKPNQQARCLG